MTTTTAAQAAPSPGAALPSLRLTVLACNHIRIISAAVPGTVSLWCEACGKIRPQASRPLTAHQEYELRIALHQAARQQRDKTRALALQAEDDLAAAEHALTALEFAPGIAAYTQDPYCAVCGWDAATGQDHPAWVDAHTFWGPHTLIGRDQ